MAFRWPVTSTTTIRTISPSCVAASPTQCPNASIVSTRSSLTRAISPASCGLPRDLLERGVRVDEDLADHRLHHVGLERPDGHLDALLGADLREHRASASGSTSAGSATSSTIA